MILSKEEFYNRYKEIKAKIIELDQRQDALQLKIDALEIEIAEEKKKQRS